MNKKIVGIIIAVILVIAAIFAGIFLFNRTEKVIEDEPNQTQMHTPTAEDIQNYLPNFTVEEIDEIMNQPLTDEELDNLSEYLDANPLISDHQRLSPPIFLIRPQN